MSLHGSSQFRRGVQRDNRRRRLLSEDINVGGASNSLALYSNTSATNEFGHYGDGSFMDEQMRLLDLVPKRWTIFLLWLIAGLGTIAGLEILHSWQSAQTTAITSVQLSAFDLSKTGCLCSWFSSLLLLSAAVMAMLVYTVRRHRTDDYHGHYRIWLWAALCWFLAATDVAANLHESFKQTMIHLTKTQIWHDGGLWWIIPYALALCALGSRLFLDMRPYWWSITSFLFAVASYVVSASMVIGLTTLNDATQTVMIMTGTAMFGHLMLLMSMALIARYVILDAEGLLPHREPKLYVEDDEKNGEKSSSTAGDEWTRVDSPVGTPQPVLRRATTPTPESSRPVKPTFSTSAAPPVPVNRQLTKQEKKALKERLLNERLERQRKM